ncbi:MFS transporter [Microbispora sp. H11081]|uniref:MFS transporter n=1 Tax=Microbispora sp. H11081 TaxID=2729107 RepID=UPI001473FC7B|nr:MFS transporter [Microbispora sp. H11081]
MTTEGAEPGRRFGSGRFGSWALTQGPLRSLRHSLFRVYWTSFALTQLGFWMANVSLQWFTARITGSDPFLLGLLYFFNLIPLMVLSPWAGVIADRFSRPRVVALSQILICLTSLTMALLFAFGGGDGLLVIYAFAFGLGMFMALASPSAQAIVVSTVPPADVPSAIGLQAASLNVARVVGPGIVTPALVMVGPGPVFAAYAAVSGLAGWLISRLKLPRQAPLTGEESTWRRIIQGIAHVRDRPIASQTLIMVAGTAVLVSAYASQLPVLAYDLLGGSDATFTALIVTTGIGAVAGALFTSWRNSVPKLKKIAMQMAAMGALLAAMMNTPWYPAVLVLAVLVSTLNFSIMTGLNVILQTVVAEHTRGRVMSLHVLAWGGMIPVGALLFGWLASLLGLALASIILGASQAALAVTMSALVSRAGGEEKGR